MAAPVNRTAPLLLAGLTLSGGTALLHQTAIAQDTALDPTRPPAMLGAAPTEARAAFAPAASGLPSGLVLQAILHTDGRPARALINGRIARTGDLVEGARIRSIDDDHVLLAIGSQSLRLELTPGVRVRPSIPAAGQAALAGTSTVRSTRAAETPTHSNRPR